MQKIFSNILTTCGFIFVVIPIIFNQWVLEKIFVWQGNQLPLSHKIIIWSGSFFLISIGFALLIYRKNLTKQINILIFIISLVFGFLMLEVILRLTISPESIALKQNGGLKIFEKGKNGLPYMTKPNLDINISLGGQTMNIKTNSIGLRWYEVAVENTLNKDRIAFVGDSQTFGAWSSTFESSLVGIFNSKIDKNNFQVINFGVPGAGFSQHEIQIKNDVVTFKPKYIVLVSYNGNDYRDTYFGKDLFYESNGILVFNEELLKNMPKEAWKNFSTPQIDPKNPILYSIKKITLTLRNSYFYVLVNDLLGKIAQNKKSTENITDFKVSDSFASTNFWSQKEYPEIGKQAVLKTIETLDSINKFCKENKINLIIVTLPFKSQVYAISESGQDYDIQFPQKYLQNYSSENQLLYLDLLPYLREYVRDNNYKNIYSEDNEHLNDTGHLICGNIISDFFNKNLIEK